MKFCIILNASSGSLIGKKIDEVEAMISKKFQNSEHSVTILKPEGKDLVRTIEQAAGEGHAAVAVGGGDGTITTAASILSKHNVPLGILPMGTMNMLAHDLGLPEKLEAAIDVLMGGKVRVIDMAEVNGEPFLCSSAIGLIPTLGRAREDQRGKPYWEKIPALVRFWAVTLYHWRGHRLTLAHDGKTEQALTRLLTIADNEYNEDAKGFLRRERLDGGTLAIYLSRHKSRLGLLWFSMGVLFHFWQKNTRLETIKTAAVTVTGRHGYLSVCNDGEIKKLKCPLNYKILPQALKVIIP